MEQSETFASFDLHSAILLALEEANFKTPSPIQSQVIPHILSGRDLVGQAQTGTGKTGAFGLPAVHLLQKNPESQMLVLVPTRELAKQVSDEIYRFGKHLQIKTAVVCGGKSFKGQIDSLQKGVQILVATPGRLLDLFESKKIPSFQPSIVVLDEADEMLDMGFLEDIKMIFQFLPQKRQTLLFSATMPTLIKKLAEKILDNPIYISSTKEETVNVNIEQSYYMIREEERDHALIRLIDCENPEKAVIFCRTKKDVDRLTQFLFESGYQAKGLHGDMEQPQRESVIRSFRSDQVQFLVATDVASRGLSVSNVSHVFNFHPPFDSTSYVHRIGRTGRAGKKGMASTLLNSREWRDFQRYEKALGTKIVQKNIPSLKEAKALRRTRSMERILAQSVDQETEQFLQSMGEVDPREVALKLISHFLSQQPVVGPENLGYVEEKRERREESRSFGSKERRNSRNDRSRSPKSFHRFKSSKPFSSKKEGFAKSKNKANANFR